MSRTQFIVVGDSPDVAMSWIAALLGCEKGFRQCRFRTELGATGESTETESVGTQTCSDVDTHGI